jgi:hypothetical protein
VLREEDHSGFRVGVFLDYRNVLWTAGHAFGIAHAELLATLCPWSLAEQAATRAYGTRHPDVSVAFVEIHYGLRDPDAPHHAEMLARWRAAGPRVVLAIRGNRRGKEVGVDIACALSCARAILSSPTRCDAAVLFSADLDLRPAPELINRSGGRPDRVRTASWHSSTAGGMKAMPSDPLRGKCTNIAMTRDALDASLRPAVTP